MQLIKFYYRIFYRYYDLRDFRDEIFKESEEDFYCIEDLWEEILREMMNANIDGVVYQYFDKETGIPNLKDLYEKGCHVVIGRTGHLPVEVNWKLELFQVLNGRARRADLMERWNCSNVTITKLLRMRRFYIRTYLLESLRENFIIM